MVWERGSRLTAGCNVAYGNVEVVSHESNYGKDGEASKDTSCAIQTTQHQAIPETQPEVRRATLQCMNVKRCLGVTTLTCNSYCCTCCSFPEPSGLLDTQRRKRRPASLRHATPGEGGRISLNIFRGYVFTLICSNNETCLKAMYSLNFCDITTTKSMYFNTALNYFLLCWVCLHARLFSLPASG